MTHAMRVRNDIGLGVISLQQQGVNGAMTYYESLIIEPEIAVFAPKARKILGVLRDPRAQHHDRDRLACAAEREECDTSQAPFQTTRGPYGRIE